MAGATTWARLSLGAALLLIGEAGAGAAVVGLETSYEGAFAEVTSSGAPCDDIFAATDYQTRHFTVGPTRRTSVLHFDGAVDGAFFDGITMVGLLGGSNDLYYEKAMTKDAVDYQVLAQGVIDLDVVYLEFSVTAVGTQGEPLCETTAAYTGFN